MSVIILVNDTFKKPDDAVLDPLKSTIAMHEVALLNEAIKDIAKPPVLTIDDLTIQEAAPRVVRAEIRRRMQVAIDSLISVCIMILGTKFKSRNFLYHTTFLEQHEAFSGKAQTLEVPLCWSRNAFRKKTGRRVQEEKNAGF